MKTPETGMKHFQYYGNNLYLRSDQPTAMPGGTEIILSNSCAEQYFILSGQLLSTIVMK